MNDIAFKWPSAKSCSVHSIIAYKTSTAVSAVCEQCSAAKSTRASALCSAVQSTLYALHYSRSSKLYNVEQRAVHVVLVRARTRSELLRSLHAHRASLLRQAPLHCAHARADVAHSERLQLTSSSTDHIRHRRVTAVYALQQQLLCYNHMCSQYCCDTPVLWQ
jgi:hypothetical protein